jgi:hypothetical protein
LLSPFGKAGRQPALAFPAQANRCFRQHQALRERQQGSGAFGGVAVQLAELSEKSRRHREMSVFVFGLIREIAM